MAAALLLAAALLAGCGGRAPELPRLAAGDTIVAFGDSLTYGTGASPEESYPAVLAQLIGRKVVGAGVPGEVSEQGLARLPGLLEEHRPKLVLLCMGGNDLLRRLDEKALAENLRAMIRLARGQGAAVVLIGVPKPGLFAPPPPLYAAVAEEFGLLYEGEIVKKLLYDNDTKSDMVHPNARGYRKLAETIAKLLKDAGAV